MVLISDTLILFLQKYRYLNINSFKLDYHKYIASFLGMNPSTLSRQKAALRDEKREKQYKENGVDDPQLFSAVLDPQKG